VCLVITFICGAAMAPTLTSAQQPSPKPADPPVPVRLKIVVERVEGDKVVNSTPFELIVKANAGGQTSLNHGRSVPVAQTTFLPLAAGGVATQPQVSYVYQSIGSNLNIVRTTATDQLISFDLMVDISSVDAAATPAGAVGPSFRKFSMQTSVTVRPGQSTVVATSTDRINGETARVTVLADIVR
jgi:hypothetical protein